MIIRIIAVIFAVAFVVTICLLALILIAKSGNLDGQDHSMDWHRRNGKWQVLYPDGKLSQPFTRGVAEDYAGMFGGTVIPKNNNSRVK